MKKLLLVLLILLVAPSAFATWAVVQHTTTTCATGTACTITITNTTAGNLLVFAEMNTNTTSTTISTIWDCASGTCTSPGIDTFVVPAGCAGVNGSRGNVNCAYVLSGAGGATKVTITLSGSATGGKVDFLEYSHNGTVVLDTGATAIATRNQVTTTTSPAGVTLALTPGTGDDVVIQMCNCSAPTAISGSFTDPADFVSSSLGVGGWIGVTSTAPTVPTWTQTNSQAELAAIAFTEPAASSTQVTGSSQVY